MRNEHDAQEDRQAAHQLKLLRAAWFACLALSTGMILVDGVRSGSAAAEQEIVAKEWVAKWPAPLRDLPVQGEDTCPTGPSKECASIATIAVDFAGNVRSAKVWAWPAQDWAVAWVPFDQWKVAREAALRAQKTDYGRRLIGLGPNGRKPDLAPLDAIWMAGSGKASWRAGLIVPPAPAAFSGKSPQKKEDAGEAPLRAFGESGVVALFRDGMRLPARMDSGHWMILAQGPADEAPGMIAALEAEPVSDALIPKAAQASAASARGQGLPGEAPGEGRPGAAKILSGSAAGPDSALGFEPGAASRPAAAAAALGAPRKEGLPAEQKEATLFSAMAENAGNAQSAASLGEPSWIDGPRSAARAAIWGQKDSASTPLEGLLHVFGAKEPIGDAKSSA